MSERSDFVQNARTILLELLWFFLAFELALRRLTALLSIENLYGRQAMTLSLTPKFGRKYSPFTPHQNLQTCR